MKLKRFLRVLWARNLEFIRDRSALSWNILLPVMIVFGFAYGYSDNDMNRYKVGVYETAASQPAFLKARYVQFIHYNNRQKAINKVVHHQLDLLVDVRAGEYWVNKESPRGYMVEGLLKSMGGGHYQRHQVEGRNVRYVDWLLPGVLGMNMMFSALFGVGYVIVRYRKNGVLKRLRATPLTAFEFITAQVVSRLWLILAITFGVLLGVKMLINFKMEGNYLLLLVVFALGAFAMISLGLLVASRTASEELAGGLLNLLTWPMIFLSGVWFSLEGLQPWVQKLAQLLPLTHITEAARAIMLEGVGLADVTPHLLVLAAMSIIFLLLGSWQFKWE